MKNNHTNLLKGAVKAFVNQSEYPIYFLMVNGALMVLANLMNERLVQDFFAMLGTITFFYVLTIGSFGVYDFIQDNKDKKASAGALVKAKAGTSVSNRKEENEDQRNVM